MEKMVELESKKADAVRNEDFLLAMNIKKQINELMNPSDSTRSCREGETKQEMSDRSTSFSLFANPLDFTHVF